MSRLMVVPFGELAERALRDAVGAAKGSDPLSPVTVCGPSPHANLSLRRRLGRRDLRLMGSPADGLVNVGLMPLPRVAELLGSSRLAGKGLRLLTDELRREFVRSVVDSSAGAFDSIKSHPNTVSALDATFGDLRESTPAELDSLAGSSARAKAVVGLYRAYREAVTGYYDDIDVMTAAAVAAREGGSAVAEVGHLIVYLPQAVGRATEAFLRALADHDQLTAIIGVTGDAEADASALAIRDRLSSFLSVNDDPVAEPTVTQTDLRISPDPEEEIRGVVRRIGVLLLEGVPLHRIALLYRSARPYALLAHEQLTAAALTHNGAQTSTLAQSLAGATVLGLIRLLEEGFPRERVLEWLRGAPVLEVEGGGQAPAEAWARIARAAGIVKGLDQWKTRLDKHLVRLAVEKQRRVDDEEDGEESPRVAKIVRELDETRRLREFMEELGKRTNLEGVNTWDAATGWADQVLDRYLGDKGDQAIWTADESDDFRKVTEALNGLKALDSAPGGFRSGAFRNALERLLTGSTRKQGRFGDGVFVGSLRQAVGARFDRVFIVGMHEGAFPPRPPEDPLLSEQERAAGDVRSRMEQLADDRRDYLAVKASSECVTLVCSRSETRTGRALLPCPWYLEAATELAGSPVYSGDVSGVQTWPWLANDVSFHAALVAGEAPASGQEYDLGSLLRACLKDGGPGAHPLLTEAPALEAGLEASAARLSDVFSPWDGRLTANAALAPSQTYPISPSSLQTWAKCPFKYLLERILRVAATELPEDSAEIQGKDRGDVYHQALEEFFVKRRGTLKPEYEWSVADRAELCRIAERITAEFEGAGVGESLAWKAERIRMRRSLNRFLEQEARVRRANGLTVVELEYPFGSDPAQAPEVTLKDGRRIRFRGKIDRVDVSEDGTLWVWDYKSGQRQFAGSVGKDKVDRGNLLQLPVYAIAALGVRPGCDVQARYWFITESGKDDKNHMGYLVDGDVMKRFGDVLRTIVDGIGGGVFPARPGAWGNRSFANCGLCAYDQVCHPDRARNWERKRQADCLAAYLDLAEGENK